MAGRSAAARFAAILMVLATSLAATSFAATGTVAAGDGRSAPDRGNRTPAPTITSFSAAPTAVTAGQSSTLSWSSTNATSCALTGASGDTEPTSGSVSTGEVNSTSAQKLTCSGAGGSTSASVTVTVKPEASCQSVAIPAYFYPTPGSNPWITAFAAQPGIGIMVANVDNGPGTTADPNYAAAIFQARAAGVAVFGYVYTDYGANSLASMEASISLWKSLYGVTDIFIDQASTTASTESYYQTLTSYVHAQAPGSLTILNFGTVPPESFMNAGDIMVTFEGDYSSYTSTTFPSWVESYAADRFYNIVYDVPDQSAMTQVLSQAEQSNVGYIYATDDTLPNPYDTVPPYLSSEASHAGSNCSL